MNQPDDVFGVAWGEDIGEAADRLGVTCDEWQSWRDEAAFESCQSSTPSRYFGRECFLRLIRLDGELAGLQCLFPEQAGSEQALSDAIRAAFDLEAGHGPDLYHGTGHGGLVRFACDEDGLCTLTVAGPRFGEFFAAREMTRGLGALGASFRP